MDDEAHLTAINAHTKGIRCHNNALRRAHELVLDSLSLRKRQTGVISGGLNTGAAEAGADVFDILSRSGIHDAERRPSREFDDAPNFFGVRRDLPYFKI